MPGAREALCADRVPRAIHLSLSINKGFKWRVETFSALKFKKEGGEKVARVISQEKVRRVLKSTPTTSRGRSQKAYWTMVHWSDKLESILHRLEREHPVWMVNGKLTYIGPFFGGGEHVWVYFWLKHCQLWLDVSVADSSVELRIGSRKISVGDDLEESLRDILTRVRMEAHIIETWSG